jgi:hypothetical protein
VRDIAQGFTRLLCMRLQKRCPSFGQDAVPMGSNFPIPAKKDKKGWCRIEEWIEVGEDLEKLNSCYVLL